MLDPLGIHLKELNILPQWNFETPMESFQLLRLPSSHSMVELRSFMRLSERKSIRVQLRSDLTESLVSGRFYMFNIAMIYVNPSLPRIRWGANKLPVPVQNYITAIIIFLIIEMLVTWGFYGKTQGPPFSSLRLLIILDYLNRAGSNVGSKILMIVVAILNAGRNSFSFFLLLIVCMGYGVVKPTLGKTMIYVRWLAGAHFIFGLIYSIASLTITPENAGKFCTSF